jgi:hypothetical protein
VRLLDGEASPVTDHWLNVTLPRYLRSYFGERCLIPAFWLLGRSAGIPQRRRPMPRSAKFAQHRFRTASPLDPFCPTALTRKNIKRTIRCEQARLPRPLPLRRVRIACRVCARRGSYRLARLAAKFGPEISLRDLTDRLSHDCLWRAEARSKKDKSACVVYLPDLEQPRPPDVPPSRYSHASPTPQLW